MRIVSREGGRRGRRGQRHGRARGERDRGVSAGRAEEARTRGGRERDATRGAHARARRSSDRRPRSTPPPRGRGSGAPRARARASRPPPPSSRSGRRRRGCRTGRIGTGPSPPSGPVSERPPSTSSPGSSLHPAVDRSKRRTLSPRPDRAPRSAGRGPRETRRARRFTSRPPSGASRRRVVYETHHAGYRTREKRVRVERRDGSGRSGMGSFLIGAFEPSTDRRAR